MSEVKAESKYRLGENLRRLMDLNGITLIEVAVVTGLPKSTLYDWMYGQIPNAPEDIMKICKFFNAHRGWMEFGTEMDPAPIPLTDERKEKISRYCADKILIQQKKREIELAEESFGLSDISEIVLQPNLER